MRADERKREDDGLGFVPLHFVCLKTCVRCRIGHLFFFKGWFVFSNVFRVRNRGTKSCHFVLWCMNHKYDFMHESTGLELGPELRYVLGRC